MSSEHPSRALPVDAVEIKKMRKMRSDLEKRIKQQEKRLERALDKRRRSSTPLKSPIQCCTPSPTTASGHQAAALSVVRPSTTPNQAQKPDVRASKPEQNSPEKVVTAPSSDCPDTGHADSHSADTVTWVPGLPFPAEYYVRTTRKMSATSSQPTEGTGVRCSPLLPSSTPSPSRRPKGRGPSQRHNRLAAATTPVPSGAPDTCTNAATAATEAVVSCQSASESDYSGANTDDARLEARIGNLITGGVAADNAFIATHTDEEECDQFCLAAHSPRTDHLVSDSVCPPPSEPKSVPEETCAKTTHPPQGNSRGAGGSGEDIASSPFSCYSDTQHSETAESSQGSADSQPRSASGKSVPKEVLALLSDAHAVTDSGPRKRRSRVSLDRSPRPKKLARPMPSSPMVAKARAFFPSPSVLPDNCHLFSPREFSLPAEFDELISLKKAKGEHCPLPRVQSDIVAEPRPELDGTECMSEAMPSGISSSSAQKQDEGAALVRCQPATPLFHELPSEQIPVSEKGSGLAFSDDGHQLEMVGTSNAVSMPHCASPPCSEPPPSDSKVLTETSLDESTAHLDNALIDFSIDYTLPCSPTSPHVETMPKCDSQQQAVSSEPVLRSQSPPRHESLVNDGSPPKSQLPRCHEPVLDELQCPSAADESTNTSMTGKVRHGAAATPTPTPDPDISLKHHCVLSHDFIGTTTQPVRCIAFGSRRLPAASNSTSPVRIQPVLAVAFPRLLVLWAACGSVSTASGGSDQYLMWEVLDKWHLNEDEHIDMVRVLDQSQSDSAVAIVGGQFADTPCCVFGVDGDDEKQRCPLVSQDPVHSWPSSDSRQFQCLSAHVLPAVDKKPGTHECGDLSCQVVLSIADHLLDQVQISVWNINCSGWRLLEGEYSLPTPHSLLGVKSFAHAANSSGLLLATSHDSLLVWNLEQRTLCCLLPLHCGGRVEEPLLLIAEQQQQDLLFVIIGLVGPEPDSHGTGHQSCAGYLLAVDVAASRCALVREYKQQETSPPLKNAVASISSSQNILSAAIGSGCVRFWRSNQPQSSTIFKWQGPVDHVACASERGLLAVAAREHGDVSLVSVQS
ncbi:uncharacterized protein LOC135831047 [Sycon ciliatum]|uniref:uncharacterized protein LOC135831047 n=1 Tax=Sycon ciliatum TaxID=27933 RepID=UPI0031F65C36